jgi:hypothetical protein
MRSSFDGCERQLLHRGPTLSGGGYGPAALVFNCCLKPCLAILADNIWA